MRHLWTLITNTPIWVLVILGYLLHAGLKSLKAQNAGLANLALLPLVFMVMSIHTLFISVGIDFISVPLWLIATSIGGYVGWLQMEKAGVSVTQEGGAKLLRVPRSRGTLWIILALFSAKFFLGFNVTTEGTFIQQTPLQIGLLCFSGVFTGLFIGRFASFFKTYFK